jgi:hypothetical protein
MQQTISNDELFWLTQENSTCIDDLTTLIVTLRQVRKARTIARESDTNALLMNIDLDISLAIRKKLNQA